LFYNCTLDLHVQLPSAVYVTVFVSALPCGIHHKIPSAVQLHTYCTCI